MGSRYAVSADCGVSGTDRNISRLCIAAARDEYTRQDALLAAAAGTFVSKLAYQAIPWRRTIMDGIIYLVGLIVIVMFILSFFGLR